jgi:ribosomal protein S18 acetylase RimI-like enzyme
MAEITYRWMAPAEIARLADLDRTERVQIGYKVQEGRMVARPVDWDVPNFFPDGEGGHSLAEQIRFCRRHLQAGGRMIGAFDGETLVGVGVLTPEIRPGMAQLAYLQVSRDHRRRGIATRLTEEMVDSARRDGARRVYVSATPSGSAVGFYRSQGFALTRDPVPELLALEPEDIHMIKELEADGG